MKLEPLVPSADNRCPVTHCLNVVGGKWKPLMLFCISHGIARFGALRRAIPGISKQMLTAQLRELEADGVITRTVYAEVPPRVEYALSARGRTLLSVIGAMRDWGEKDLSQPPAP
ncbi:MAG: helix-turn-helix domain-containing protein [Pseudomonadota bacterium]